jgi:hypothetical protein
MPNIIPVIVHAILVYLGLLLDSPPAAALNAILALYWIAREVKS